MFKVDNNDTKTRSKTCSKLRGKKTIKNIVKIPILI